MADSLVGSHGRSSILKRPMCLEEEIATSANQSLVRLSTGAAEDSRAVENIITESLVEMVGTMVSMNTPLMTAGLDSIAASEFANVLAD